MLKIIMVITTINNGELVETREEVPSLQDCTKYIYDLANMAFTYKKHFKGECIIQMKEGTQVISNAWYPSSGNNGELN